MKLTILVVLFTLYFNSFAQIDTLQSPMMKVILKDSTIYYGRITSKENDKLTFTQKNGVEIIIPQDSILEIYRMQDLSKEVKKEEPKIIEEKKYTDKGLHRMFFFPTANPIPNGEGFVSSNMLFFPFAAFGLANIFSFGGGISLLPGAEHQIYYFSPKITFLKLSKFAFAAGGFIFNSFNFTSRNNYTGMAYLIGTFNSSNNNFTAGLAFGHNDGKFDEGTMIFLAAQAHIKNGSNFLTEIWIPSSKNTFPEIAIVFFGFRFYNENFSGDVGLIRPANYNNQGFPFIPWINLTYNFKFIKT